MFNKIKFSGRENGMTFVELLVIMAIMSVIFVFSVFTLDSFNKREVLKKETSAVRSALEEARNLTLTAKDSMSYGVRFEEHKLIFFGGDSYSTTSPTNQVRSLSPRVRISGLSLSGGGADVVFKKISGATNQDGAIVISETADPAKSYTVKIAPTGIISVGY